MMPTSRKSGVFVFYSIQCNFIYTACVTSATETQKRREKVCPGFKAARLGRVAPRLTPPPTS